MRARVHVFKRRALVTLLVFSFFLSISAGIPADAKTRKPSVAEINEAKQKEAEKKATREAEKKAKREAWPPSLPPLPGLPPSPLRDTTANKDEQVCTSIARSMLCFPRRTSPESEQRA